uniref:Translation initiation factor eIF2B subunit gamma n=1 Tax=Amphimedon queenslandica TaxID=400682 RepID=A0A1X7UAW9_AMPQE
MDLHPVLLAGGQASGLYPLNEAYPKALLPVGNKPLLYYPLRLLEKNNFKEVTVIVNSRDLKSIKQSLDEYPRLASSDIEFNTFEVHDSDETGSAVALSALKASGRIKSDLLVLSCDVLSTVSLIQLWEKHVTLRSAVSLLLVKPLPSNNSDERQKTSTPAFDRTALVKFHVGLWNKWTRNKVKCKFNY